MRQEPIPAPSEPMQYRAIGLVQGLYTPSDEQINRGQLVTSDGQAIEASVLGRVISLLKNHLNLTEEHLWVVYPRTQDAKSKKSVPSAESSPIPELKLQIVGIWEPETLHPPLEDGEAAPADSKSEQPEKPPTEASDLAMKPLRPTVKAPQTSTDSELPSPDIADGYFSIRGEIIYFANDRNSIIVKIQQSNRKDPDQRRDFKLHLCGSLEHDRILHHFWDFHVQRQGERLMVTHAHCVGPIPPRRRSKKELNRKPFKRQKSFSPEGNAPQRSGGAPAKSSKSFSKSQKSSTSGD